MLLSCKQYVCPKCTDRVLDLRLQCARLEVVEKCDVSLCDSDERVRADETAEFVRLVQAEPLLQHELRTNALRSLDVTCARTRCGHVRDLLQITTYKFTALQ